MRILYISVHSILEYDELSLFRDMGHDFFSLGAYHNPEGHPGLPRPSIPGAEYHQDLDIIYVNNPNRNEIHQAIIDWSDVIIVMHSPDILSCNWHRIKHKKVIFRSIGQSLPHVEEMLQSLRREGLKIIRYSPKERLIPGYAGEDAIIRFYKDPNELQGWNGNDASVINFTQSLKGRRNFCHYNEIVEVMSGYPSKIYGTGNEDLGNLNGGELPWELMKGKLRDSRAFMYGGTFPAQYTLAFMEAWMTGIPIVSIGKNLAENLPGIQRVDFFEIPEFIENGVNGFISDDINTLRSYVYQLLSDHAFAKTISENGRKKAIEIFGKEPIRRQWEDFLKSL